ncbi:MAG TPA: type IV secretory system conjugative DNA transfer family protein [Thermoanaerobaculaceae bacterium]|nr:type IV secretory system conjugative DNA transfer family protein [Thermoanaerobaculaceae bacterium]
MSADTLLHFTSDTRQVRDWRAATEFWLAKDRFLHFMLKRQEEGGFPFAAYRTADGSDVPCHLTGPDFRQHALILGATGCGKSSLLESWARALLDRAQSFALIDPHGDLADRVARWAYSSRSLRVRVLDFTDPSTMPSWNPLAPMQGVDAGRQIDLLLGIIRRLFIGKGAAPSWYWGVMSEEILRATLRAAIESREPMTLLDVERFLLDPGFRGQVLETAGPEVQSYFLDRFGAKQEMYVSAVLNKLTPLLSSKVVQAFLGRGSARFDLLDELDRPTALIVNLARGSLGAAADVLGRLIINSLLLSALRRERQRPEVRRPAVVLVDEAHSFAGEESGLTDLLVAGRKYKVAVALASQGLSLFAPALRPLLLGNTTRQFFFRLPHSEAQLLGRDILEPLGSIPRVAVRPYDRIRDPLLTPDEEIAARIREMTDLPTGACYWAIRGRRFRARRIQLRRPEKPPTLSTTPVSTGVTIDEYSARPAPRS